MMSEKRLKERIYELRRELDILEEVLETKREGFGRPIGSTKFTSEQIKFLKDNKDMEMKGLVKVFNTIFKTKYPEDTRALYNFMDRTGIITPTFRRNENWKLRGQKND